MSGLILIHPTLAGAITKIERSLIYLKTQRPNSDLLGNTLEYLKSAARLVGSHRTVLIEMESELPEPGPALFDAAGGPAPGAELSGCPGLRLEEHPVLAMTEEDYLDCSRQKQEHLDEELLFALRLHTRARYLDYDAIHELVMCDMNGIGVDTFTWLVEQITTSGDFVWPHCCEDCQCADTPDATGQVLCWSCKNKREREAAAARVKAQKDADKAAKKAEKKAAPKPARNPLMDEPKGGPGDNE